MARNLDRFLGSFYPNLGFAAQFRGFEGLDVDSISFKNEPVVLMTPGLVHGHEREKLNEPRKSRPRLDVLDVALNTPSCWIVSIAHDLQIDSIQNLKRFEHHFERARPPEDRLFPFTAQGYFPPNHKMATKVPVTLTTSNQSFLAVVRDAVATALGSAGRPPPARQLSWPWTGRPRDDEAGIPQPPLDPVAYAAWYAIFGARLVPGSQADLDLSPADPPASAAESVTEAAVPEHEDGQADDGGGA
ncbi:MAG: hypothetical protein FJ399_20005 [Verrucomicrobia bacterium]|nr:hypothetical protein [Verrucomicrobiota bacterium]